MASLEGFITIVLLTVLHTQADDGTCTFPTFMLEAPGWDMGVRNEGRSSGSYIIFEESKMVTIDYENWSNPEKETLCVQSFEGDKAIVRFPSDDTILYKCIKFIKRSTHIAQILESEPSTIMDVTQCDDSSLAINDWLMVWAEKPNEYQNCGMSGGYSIMDIHVPSRDQHFCQDLALPPRIEIECQYGEGILINFRYPQCVTDVSVNMPIYEMKFTCLGTWTSYGFTYTVITDGASFLPRLWLMRFPVNANSDFYMDFIKDIVADRNETVVQTQENLRWKLVRNVFPSLCEDESSDCSDCAEDGGFYCQKTCQQCDPVQVQERCSFEQSLKGEWLESSWSGSRTIRITSSLLYPTRLSPFECFVIGGSDSLDWLKITGRQTIVSVHKNGCRPRYSCVAINNINPTVIQYRLSQGIVWPHSQNLQAENICDYNQFQDDSQPLGSRYRSQYEKYLVKIPSGRNRQPSACNLNGNFVFSAIFNNEDADTCVGTLKQCSDDQTKLVLHVPYCQNWKSLTLSCLSSTVEVRERFIIVGDPENPQNIYCIVTSTEPNKDKMYLLHASDCHVNILITIQYGHFTQQIANFQSVEMYNSTTECSMSDIGTQDRSEQSTSNNVYDETDTMTDANVDETVEQTTTIDETTTRKKIDQNTMPLFSKGFDVSSTEKQFDSISASSVVSSEFTTLSSTVIKHKSSTTEKNIQRDVSSPDVLEVKSVGSTLPFDTLVYYIILILSLLI